MAVPVSRHFALPETALFIRNNLALRPLSEEEMNELENIREKHQNTVGITNTELNFLLKLYYSGGGTPA